MRKFLIHQLLGALLVLNAGWTRHCFSQDALSAALPSAVTSGDVELLIGAEVPPPPDGFESPEAVQRAIRDRKIQPIDNNTEFPNVEVKRNVAYSQVAEHRGVLDLYLPKNGAHPRPVIVLIHGGGWRGGAKEDYQYYGQQFAHRGYVAAVINYRLVPHARYPSQVQDVKTAIRWVRSRANELNLNPDQIAVMGGSAGGHLAMMAGYAADVPEFDSGELQEVSSAVQAVINIYGPTDLTQSFDEAIAMVPTLIRDFLGESEEDVARHAAQASPLTHLAKGAPPTLIFHGTIDNLVPIQQGDLLAARLEELKVPYVYDRLPGWPHGMDIARPINDRMLFLTTRFLQNVFQVEKGDENAE